MFIVNEDNSIYVTRGDIVVLAVTADDNGKPRMFQPGEVLRIKVFGKKDCETVVLQKDFLVTTETDAVEIALKEEETKIGEVINKPVDYWYEVELNPEDNPQTIIGYDDEGAKVFRLFPEGADIEADDPSTASVHPEYIDGVDKELDYESHRPVENGAITRAIARLEGAIKGVAKYVTPEMYGAIGDGVTDDTNAIQNAINDCPQFSTLEFQNKTYCVSKPIEVSKKVNIVGQKAVLKATKEMDCVLRFTNHGSLNPCSVEQITADANNLANVGFKIGGAGHTTQITFRECVAKKAISHGFYLLPISYIVNFVSCLAANNGGDGLNAVATDSANQINAIHIEKCSFQNNAESGASVNGVSISVTECDSESNKYGFCIGGVDYVTYGVNFNNCHLENNTIASVLVDTKSAAKVTVRQCYLYQQAYDEENGVIAFIKCTESTMETTLFVDENIFAGNSKLNYVDGGNKLSESSVINVDNISRLVNTKRAKVVTRDTTEKYLPIPMSLCGALAADCRSSVNLVETDKSVKLIVPYCLANAITRLIGVHVTTNGTTAKIVCYANVYDGSDKKIVNQTAFSATITESGLYTFNLLNNWGYKRIANNTFMELNFVLDTSGNASIVELSDPYITAYM